MQHALVKLQKIIRRPTKRSVSVRLENGKPLTEPKREFIPEKVAEWIGRLESTSEQRLYIRTSLVVSVVEVSIQDINAGGVPTTIIKVDYSAALFVIRAIWQSPMSKNLG